MGQFIIRNARAEDAEALVAMQQQLDTETKNMMYEPGERPADWWVLAHQLERLEEEGSAMFLAFDGEQLVGFLKAERGAPRRIAHSAYLTIGLLACARGKGLGTALFQMLEEWAQGAGLTRLELIVRRDNDIAIRLYQKFGFEIEGIKPRALFVDGAYVDEYLMGRLL
ncbi:MAG: GNAT family N-acetyltransferase [Clostridia bacterium]|nr:GNAT family N-acetyltransferase [Clostridia bacterium]